MDSIINAALSRSRTVICGLVLLLMSGLGAYFTIPREAFPDINVPIVYVSLSLQGISPEDAERLLLRPVEQEMKGIEGVKEMRSSAYQGGGNVVLEFDAGFDVDKALDDVRQKVDLAKPELPEEADEPTVNEVNFSLFPMVVVTLSGNVPERTLIKLANDLQEDIEGIPSILSADIIGDREQQLDILINPNLIESYGLNFADILGFFNRNNQLVAAGNLDTGGGRFAVKVPGLFKTVEDITSMPVKVDGDSVTLVKDITEIRSGFKDPESFARINGKPAIALEVVKRTGENALSTIALVKQAVEAKRAEWPENVEINLTQDNSTEITTMLSDLRNNVISAIVLVLIICIADLGLRTSALIGISVPGSFLITILALSLMGYSLNNVILFGLILTVGIVVDGAIVVTEYADRKMTEGYDKREAYREAAQRMAWPVIASAATIVASFLPLMFWPGVVGEFMKYLPITVNVSLVASVVMAMIFIPTLGAIFGKPMPDADLEQAKRLESGEPLRRDENGNFTELKGVTKWYVELLDKALNNSGKIILASIGLLIGIQVLYGIFGKGVEFFPSEEPRNAQVNVHARGNLSIWEQDGLIKQVEDRVLDIKGIKTVYSRTGGGNGSSGGGDDVAEDVIGTLSLEFEDWDVRPKADAILTEVRDKTKDLAGIRIETAKEEGGPPVGKPIQIQLSSDYPEALPPIAAKIRAVLDGIEGLVDIEDSRPLPGIEWEITVDRAQAAKFGLDVSAIGQYIRMITNGQVIDSYRPDGADDEVDITVRFPEGYRSITELENIRIETGKGSVPISNFVKRIARERVGTVNRIDGKRIMTIKANLLPDLLASDKLLEVQSKITPDMLDPRVKLEYRGEDEEQAESQAFLSSAFLYALFLIAVILITQFNSFYSTFLILSAVIMSTIGVFGGLIITQQPFSIVMTGIGVISLAGMVVSNNIILIDTFDSLKTRTDSIRTAILKTGAQRWRPVFLTAVTTILGLVPMAMSTNIDFFTREVSVGAPSTMWWVPISTAIVFGLTFATVLTLIITPCALMLKVQLAEHRKTIFAKIKHMLTLR